MTIRLQQPELKREWLWIGSSLALALAETLALNPARAAAHIRDSLRDAVKEPTPNASSLAWLWRQETALRALLSVMTTPRLRSELSAEELRVEISRNIDLLVESNDEEYLTEASLYDPITLRSLHMLETSVVSLAKQISPEHPFSDQEIRDLYRNALQDEGSRVLTENADYYSAVAEILFGPIGAPARRKLAWLRHSNWVRGLYTRQPIFSPNDDEQVPLSSVFLRQRCFWYERTDSAADDKQRSVVHIDDLHTSSHEWLSASAIDDPIRIIAGGPGSGKSSFARAFASEVLSKRSHHIVFIPLQRLKLSSDISADLGRYLQQTNNEHDPNGSQGLPENPLLWRANDPTPILLIFDGLDELSYSDDSSKMLARQLIFSLRNLLIMLNTSGPAVKAMILGRSAACQDALKEADLDARTMLNIAPLRPISTDDFAYRGYGNSSISVVDIDDLSLIDQRATYWLQWKKIRGLIENDIPESITDVRLSDLNAEPLLLHLLIISDFSGPRWKEAINNRNLVYRDIFEKIFERNKRKNLFSAHNITKEDFFVLMECLGLSSWHGNGRTGSAEDFRKIRKIHANREKRFGQLESAELKSVALQIHTRRDTTSGDGFEFIHKSFGEYLAGRALLNACVLIADEINERAEPEDVAPHWVQLVGPAEMTSQVLEFLTNEAELQARELGESRLRTLTASLTQFMNWTLREGMPVHRIEGAFPFRVLETRQRCAEAALFCGLSALTSTLPPPNKGFGAERNRVRLEWPDPDAASHMLHRLFATSGNTVGRALARIDLRGVDLRSVELSYADLSYADLRNADLSHCTLFQVDFGNALLDSARLYSSNLVRCNMSKATLRNADLSRANLRGADLRGADLAEAKFEQADFGGTESMMAAKLRRAKNLTQGQIESATGGVKVTLPKGLTIPDHWDY